MNTTTPPIDPLDPDERELARVLRALPGGDPPAALDARILRAAHDALAQPAPRRRVLWAGGSSGALWGIGSAAAAILAVGIGWKLVVPPDSSLPVPRALPTVSDSTNDQETLPVEFKPMPQRREDDAMAPPPPPAPVLKEEAPRRRVMPSPPPPPASPPAAAAPEPFPQAETEQLRASAPADAASSEAGLANQAPAPAAEATGGADGRDARSAFTERQRDEALGRLQSGAAKAAAPAPASAESSADTGSLDTVVVTDDAVSTRVAPDAKLAATAWLERIRARARAGDTTSARASLRLFVQRHPQSAIPVDLRPLLDE